MVQPKAGVGSFDESFSKALLTGRPIIVLDNLRKRIDSTVIESFTTAGGRVQARALRTDGEVDSRYYVLYATSNGFESTPDIANRMCMVRILHQPEGYQWYPWREGSLLKHISANRGLYLGAICSVLRAWIDQGMRSIPCRHDQHEWAGAMNWVVQHLFQLPDLMEGHDELKRRVADPTQVFLREIALTIKEDEAEFSTTDLVDRAKGSGIGLPDWDGARQDNDAAIKHMGILLGKSFSKNEVIEMDGFTITRSEKLVPRRQEGEGNWPKKIYTFKKAGDPRPAVPRARPAGSFFNVPPKTAVTAATAATLSGMCVCEKIAEEEKDKKKI